MTSSSPRHVQQQRARTDFEHAIGDALWELLADDRINDVNIRPNGKVIYQAPGGRKTHPTISYLPDESEDLARAILQCQNPVQQLNDDNQAADCKMPLSDGVHFARVHIDAPPSCGPGHQICIRKQTVVAPTFEQGWIAPGYMHPDYLDVFRWTIEERLNLIICGKMYSGKTTLRNSYFDLMYELDPQRALVEILDVDETVARHDDFVKLHITKNRSAADHCKSFVRMSSEAVGINELRGGEEAYELVHDLWLSGHNGSSTTFHVDTPEELIWRLSTKIASTGHTPQLEVIVRAVNVAVFLRYAPDIGRRVTEVVHFQGVNADGSLKYEHLGPRYPWPTQRSSSAYTRRPAA